MRMFKGVNTPERVIRSASRWNTALATGQLIAATLFGNVGFAGEAAHNAADALSFDAKGRALRSECRHRAVRLRKFAASILLAGGVAAMTAGAHQLDAGDHENTSPAAISIAFGGAVLNTAIALRTHRAEHDLETHACMQGAHADSKLHAVTDALTGGLYAAGLLVGNVYTPEVASAVVIINGAISAGAGVVTLSNIAHDQRGHGHEHELQ